MNVADRASSSTIWCRGSFFSLPQLEKRDLITATAVGAIALYAAYYFFRGQYILQTQDKKNKIEQTSSSLKRNDSVEEKKWEVATGVRFCLLKTVDIVPTQFSPPPRILISSNSSNGVVAAEEDSSIDDEPRVGGEPAKESGSIAEESQDNLRTGSSFVECESHQQIVSIIENPLIQSLHETETLGEISLPKEDSEDDSFDIVGGNLSPIKRNQISDGSESITSFFRSVIGKGAKKVIRMIW